MDKDSHYVAVGGFVVAAVIAAVVFVNWYGQRIGSAELERYTIYFSGSVSGLSEGGPVRYLGVNVGRVRRISLDVGQRRRVRVLIEVDAGTPISTSTEASLRLQGVTGLLYIELSEDEAAGRPLTAPAGEPYPVIATSPSQLDQLVAGLPEMVERVTALLERSEQLLSDQNIEAVSASLANLREATRDLPDTVVDIGRLIGRLETAMGDIGDGARRIGAMTERIEPDVLTALDRLGSAAKNLGDMSARLDQFVARNEGRIDQFADRGLADLQRLVEQARTTGAELEALAAKLRRDPSRLISRPNYQGVEIER